MKPFLTAQWRHLAMVNYAIDPALLTPYIPADTSLDLWQNKAYVSLVGFLFLNTRLLGIPIPGHQNFEEFNLRFYVTRDTGSEIRRGAVFIREIVPRWAIAKVARDLYNEPYLYTSMRHHVDVQPNHIAARYEFEWKKVWQHLAVQTQGEPMALAENTLNQYIADHYWGYTAQTDGSTLEYRVTHPSWQVRTATLTALSIDTEALYGKPFAFLKNASPDSVFLAEGSPVTVSYGVRLT